MLRFLIVLCAIFLPLGCSGSQARHGNLVKVSPIMLDPDHPDRRRVGQLHFASGFELRSANEHFGGFSSMLLSPDGHGLTVLSDRGWYFQGTLQHDAEGRMTGARVKGEGRELPGLASGRRRYRDSESMVQLPDGDILVGFEGKHAVRRFPGGLGSKPQELQLPEGVSRLPSNGGLETMAALPDGRLLLIAEEGSGGTSPAWLGGPGAWAEATYVQKGDFRPTDAAVMPCGDVLILERRFTWVGGMAARIIRLPAADVQAGARLEGQEIARFDWPMTVDNFEAIAVRELPGGKLAVYIMSDDNFSVFQHTYLMQFFLEERP